MPKKKPKAPQACSQAGNWFVHRSNACNMLIKATQKRNSLPPIQEPPRFQLRNRRNFQNSNLFSEFDNRWDHDKKKKIINEITHRYNYESPEMLTWNRNVNNNYETTTSCVHKPLKMARDQIRRYPKEYSDRNILSKTIDSHNFQATL
jgi:hypothetical protein